MLQFRRRDEGENPAWPGLVDIFAFTLVFVLLLGFADINLFREENERLKKEINGLKKEITEFKEGVRGLRELKEFYGIVKTRLPENFSITFNEDAIEIVIKGVPPIYFETGEYNLSSLDSQRLSRLAPIIFSLIQGRPFYVLINGTADPRFLPDRGIPPHNNVELSALRSATVADLLEKVAPGVGRYLRVAGLGVRGEEAPPGVDREEYYRQFRTVNLLIKVDVEKLQSQ